MLCIGHIWKIWKYESNILSGLLIGFCILLLIVIYMTHEYMLEF